MRIVPVATPDLMSEITNLRWDVFVIEQKVPPVLEIDAYDFCPDVVHLAALTENDDVVGTVRIIPEGQNHYHLGRLAVRKEMRGQALGKALVKAVHDYVACLTPEGENAVILLNAQVAAISFYEQSGYTATDTPVFLEAGIKHQEMFLSLTGQQYC